MRDSQAIVLQAGEGRGKILKIFGDEVTVKCSTTDTGGWYSILEDTTKPQCGPPLHRHLCEDESFYVLEGEYLFEIDGERVYAGPGASVYAPRGSAHTFQNVGESKGRMLVMVQPGGLDRFFRELDAATAGMRKPDPTVVLPVFEKYKIELLGPPLPVQEGVASAAD
jgi:mannose-6-phosphate isomerase-like protein (cupin superfamily)